jgi:hypothetical protein
MPKRPYKGLKLPEALTVLSAIGDGESSLDAALMIADEFLIHTKRRESTRRKILKTIAELPLRVGRSGLIYTPWLNEARATCQAVSAKTRRKPGVSHNIYVILTIGYGSSGMEPGLYVGETSLQPNQRFAQHIAGGPTAAYRLPDRAVCLLPSFYKHLNPLSKAEAKRLEFDLVETLRATAGPRLKRRIRGPHVAPPP